MRKGDIPDPPFDEKILQGDRFSPYSIIERIGAGGMGDVYKAFDKRLNRTVAIKVLKASFSDRFQREARAIAALNHPGICTLYDVGHDYLVMEYIEGRPLSGPLPLEKLSPMAEQICDALYAAHRTGIIHRDLKPANILVTKQGIKLLDFGIAQMVVGESTVTYPGVVVGTPAYMAPETLTGQPADVRSDIYSLGCVLHEIVTGGRQRSETLDPAGLERVIRTCLADDPDQRWQTAREVKIALGMIRQPAPAAQKPRSWLLAGVGAMFIALVVFIGWVTRRAEQPFPYRFTLEPPAGRRFSSTAISPDATMLAFSTALPDKHLWIRRLDTLQDVALPDTVGAEVPVWSPDSRRVAFFAQNKLKTVDIQRGTIKTLCEMDEFGGGSWSRDDVLLFVKDRVIHRISAEGGLPVAVTRLDSAAKETGHATAWFLPDDRHFLFSVGYAGPKATTVHVGSLDSLDYRKRLIEVDAGRVAYAPPPPSTLARNDGYLLFMRGGVLMAQALDPHRFELRGDMFPVNHNVTAFSVSSVGAVATRSDPSPPLQHLVWRDRRGREMGVVGDPGRFGLMSLSLNAARLAHLILDPATGETDIWVRELPQGASWRLPSKGREFEPVWSPDGTQLIFGLGGLRPRSFLYRLASMAGEPERIGPDGRPSDWSRDGAYLLLVVGSPSNTVDLQVLKLGEQMPVPFVDSPSNERDGRFSPDASGPPRWIAYSEQVGNQSEVFVQSFSPGKHAAGAKWKISLSGGVQPRWRGDGKEIFYRDGQKLMAVPVDMSGTGFRPGTPVTLFEASPALNYAVASDGSRFLLSEEVPNQPPLKAPPVTVILNWQSLRH